MSGGAWSGREEAVDQGKGGYVCCSGWSARVRWRQCCEVETRVQVTYEVVTENVGISGVRKVGG